LHKLDPHRLVGRGGAVLNRKGERVALTPQVEVGFSPGVELRGAAQRLPRPGAPGPLLGVVDDENGKGMSPLQLSQISKERGDLTAGVLVDAVEPHKGVEDQEPGLQLGNRLGKGAPIDLEIEAQGGGGDDLDVEITQAHAGGGGDALQPPAHDRRGIFRRIEQDAPRVWDSKAAQAGYAGGNGNGDIERQERLAALWARHRRCRRRHMTIDR
jgi:hypothetical protein